MVRILVADRHDVVRAGVRQTFEAKSNWEIVGEAADGQEAIAKAIELKPDVAVLGYWLHAFNGIEVTRQIRAHLPKTEVLIFTVHDSEAVIEEVFKAGARGYVLKSDGNHTLIEAVEALVSRKSFFSDQISETQLKACHSKTNGSGSSLTHRERGVVQLIAEGHSNKQTARLLDISLKTVETHRANVMRKLDLSSSAGLIRYAIRNNLTEA
jgi:DNA-binding NarL/FixJ family response regulator